MGTYLTGTYSVLHTDATADFDNFVYDAVYFSTGTSMTINGIVVTGVIGETLEITVDGNTSTPIAGVLLLGNPIAPQTKVQTGLISGDSHNEVWQFVNIKTGNPTNG
mgnify:CR=1 FL=1